MGQQRGSVGITIQPFSGKLTVSILTRMRKAVAERLVTLGATQDRESHFSGIPERYLERVKEIFAEEYPHWEIRVRDLRPQLVVEGGKVTWNRTENRHSQIWHGYLGQIEVFTCSSSYDYKTRGYLMMLHTKLPGYLEHEPVKKAGDLREAQEAAEVVIKQWLRKTGLANV